MRKLLLAMVLALPLVAFSFGSSNSSQDVGFEVHPEAPMVFLNDTTIGSGESSFRVTAPWFLTALSIYNYSDDYELYITSVRFVSRAQLDNGAITETQYLLDAEKACRLVDKPKRSLFAKVYPKAVFRGDANCDGSDDGMNDREMFYIDSLAFGITVFDVTATIEGYFYDPKDPTDPIKSRVKKSVSFKTQ